MKITLRKKNSVTSIVLFLYNLNFEYKENYKISLKHLLDYVKLFNKKESAIRMSLSRLERSDILEKKTIDGEKYYYLSKKGKENIDDWNLGITRFFKRLKFRHKSWNEQWVVLNLLDFKKSLNKNRVIIDNLEELGLRELENNLWITPYMIESELIELLQKNRIDYLMSYSKLKYSQSINDMIQNYYLLGQLRDNYSRLNEKLNNTKAILDSLTDQEAITILFDLGWEFYSIVTCDPLLPNKINPDWIGINVQDEFQRVRKKLIKKAFNYIK